MAPNNISASDSNRIYDAQAASARAAGRPGRARSTQVDQLRARALLGDALGDLRESQREWVWRSLLKGVRLAKACTLAGLSPHDVEPALQRIRTQYRGRTQALRAHTEPIQPAPAAAPTLPGVSAQAASSRPVPPPPAPAPRVRWPFRRR